MRAVSILVDVALAGAAAAGALVEVAV